MPAHKNFFYTSDFIIYFLIILSLILELLFPTKILFDKSILMHIGLVILVLAWVIIFTAKYQFKKFNQKSGPGNETTLLIKDGLFGYSRNPIYLGVLLICPALGFILDSLYLIIAIIPVFILLKYMLIIPEEKYLAEKFGGEYSDYLRKVRRWV